MIVLKPLEQQAIKNILKGYFLGASRPVRLARLVTANVMDVCQDINPDDSGFVELLLAQLLTHRLATMGNQCALVVFLEHLETEPEINEEDQEVIQHILTVCQAQLAPPPATRRTSILDMLAEARREPVSAAVVDAQRMPVDRTLIVDYDLDKLMGQFRQRLGYQGVFSFTMTGEQHFLENYILERIVKELRSKTRRPVRPPLHIPLHWTDVGGASLDIEEELCHQCQGSDLKTLIRESGSSDLILVIWNYDIPADKITTIARPFWKKVQQEIAPTLTSRCLVLVWVNVGGDKIPMELDESTALQVPQHFDVQDLIPYIRGCLLQHQMEEAIITRCVTRLQRRGGHLIATYREMVQIVKELQGGTA
ncbi:MAG: hypothetical protein H0T73_16340 [Ardenticatenales bacterium]|nr:hypothetical protein [Ardenticatenales bacterium]